MASVVMTPAFEAHFDDDGELTTVVPGVMEGYVREVLREIDEFAAIGVSIAPDSVAGDVAQLLGGEVWYDKSVPEIDETATY